MKTLTTILALLITAMTFSQVQQPMLYTIDCSGTDTTGYIDTWGGKWSIELLNDSVSTSTPSIDFRASNKRNASFDLLPALQFSNATYDSIPYTYGTGKPNYPFGYEYNNYRFLYYKGTCGASTEKMLFIYVR